MSSTSAESERAPTPRTRAAIDWIGRTVFRYRDYLAPAGLVLILACTRPRPFLGTAAADVWLDLFGVLLAAIGQALRITVIGYAYIQRGGAGKRLAAPKLVAEGFYAHSRNPMYVGNMLLLCGLAIIYNSIWVYALILPVYIGGLLSIVKAEEHFLAEKFGAEYADYCARVNRFLPGLRGLRQTLAGMRFDWKRVVRKEYGTTFAWMAAAVFLMVWERLMWSGYAASRAQIHALLALYVPLIAAWGTARWLKKSARLD